MGDHDLTAHAEALHMATCAFLDALVANGVSELCWCPGSRSTPLIIEAERHDAIHTWAHLDERACAYFALGMARAREAPVAILCTSGTAAANFAPAVAEARLAHIPLVVLTADRPRELRAVGAPQTIEQNGIFGAHAKAFIEVASPQAGRPDLADHAGQAGARAAALAASAPSGPVHCNLPYSEPLVPLAPSDPPPTAASRVARTALRRPEVDDLLPWIDFMTEARHPLIICGPQFDPAAGESLTRLAAAINAPLLADPLSQLRGGIGVGSCVVDSYDAVLRQRDDRLRPDALLQFGAVPTSKTLQHWLGDLARDGVRRLICAGDAEWPDYTQAPAESIDANIAATARVLADSLEHRANRADPTWRTCWQAAEVAAATLIEQTLTADEREAAPLSEMNVVRDATRLVPDGGAMVLGNGMPIRDADTVLRRTDRRFAVYSNRGANGIDGVLSSAAGIACERGTPTVLVVGDVSFYHDLPGMLALRQHAPLLTVVIINNDGGGIFQFLPQADTVPEFEILFGTPHGLSFEHAAAMFDLPYTKPSDAESFRAAVRDSIATPGPSIIEAQTDRVANRAKHEELWGRVAVTVRAALDGLT